MFQTKILCILEHLEISGIILNSIAKLLYMHHSLKHIVSKIFLILHVYQCLSNECSYTIKKKVLQFRFLLSKSQSQLSFVNKTQLLYNLLQWCYLHECITRCCMHVSLLHFSFFQEYKASGTFPDCEGHETLCKWIFRVFIQYCIFPGICNVNPPI